MKYGYFSKKVALENDLNSGGGGGGTESTILSDNSQYSTTSAYVEVPLSEDPLNFDFFVFVVDEGDLGTYTTRKTIDEIKDGQVVRVKNHNGNEDLKFKVSSTKLYDFQYSGDYVEAYISMEAIKNSGIVDLTNRVHALESDVFPIKNTEIPAIDMRLDDVEEVTNVLGSITNYNGSANTITPNVEKEIANFELEKGTYLIKAIVRIGSGMENHSLSAALSQTKDSVFASGEYEITHTSISRASANIIRIIDVETTTQYYLNAIHTATQNKTIGYDIKICKLK